MTTRIESPAIASAGRDGGLPPIPGVDPSLDPRLADPERYRAGRVRAWWSKVLDPVELSSSSSRWSWRPAVALAAVYVVAGTIWIVVSSSLVSGPSWQNVEIAKGVGYVVVSGVLLGALLLQYGRRARRAANRLRELIEAAGDVTFRYRIWPTVGFEYISPGVEHWMGLPADRYYELPDLFLRHIHPDDRARFSQLLAYSHTDAPALVRWLAPDGRVLDSHIDLRSVVDRRGRVVAIDGRIRDVTDIRRDRAESEIGSATLEHLSNGSSLRQVIEGVCEQLVDLLGVEIVAVGIPRPDGAIEMYSAAGDVRALDELEIRWDEGPLADGPTGRCVQAREPVVMTPDERGFAAWRQRVRDTGVTACLAVPIVRDDAVIATLTLWSRFGNPFDANNVERFDRIGRRLAFAVAQLPEAPPRSGDDVPISRIEPAVDIRRALDEGRFEPWWQPQVAADGRVVALEMLMRMRDDEGEIVGPNVFIPAAEDQGMMTAIGRFARRRALDEAVPWLRSGLERICLNVSVGELLSPGFVSEMEGLIGRADLRPEQIELELVETAPLDSVARRVVARVVEMGLRVAVDDYGSGWASLSHLSTLPASVIKIDRVFIRDVTESVRSQTLVKSTVELGRSLELVTVAEGVETGAQVSLLVGYGCDLMQGFLFSPPASAEHIDALLRSGGRPFWPIIASSQQPATV